MTGLEGGQYRVMSYNTSLLATGSYTSRIKNGEYTYIINTTAGRQAIEDSKLIRRSALQYKVHYDTTLNGGFATAMALNADATEKVISVQEMHAQIAR
jgi:carbamoyl-phosphate synthase large subunit